MKKDIQSFALTLVVALILSIFLPWWSVMLAAIFSEIVVPLKGFKVFMVPFLSIFTLWIGYAILVSIDNDFLLAKKIAVLLPLQGQVYLIVILTGVIGGLAAGIGGILGKQFSNLLKKDRAGS